MILKLYYQLDPLFMYFCYKRTVFSRWNSCSVLFGPARTTFPYIQLSISEMYKQYRDDVSSKRNSEVHDNHDRKDNGPLKDVEECWNVIHSHLSSHHETVNSDDDPHCINSSWKPIRLFVSSTFADFFNEREVLVKRVFPELQEWLNQRSLYLVECDLRWGIPKLTSTADTIATCMEEIDRCIQDNIRPFFLNMTGNRFGWIPGRDDVPENIREMYHWVDNVSITCMEILHGAFWTKNKNALFMFRDIEGTIPIEHEIYFTDTDPVSGCHVERLKSEIYTRFPNQVFKYSCTVKGVEELSGKDRVVLTGLDEFCKRVLNFFKEAITKECGDNKSQQASNLYQKELRSHTQYMHQKSETVYGRKEEQDFLKQFMDGECKIEPDSKAAVDESFLSEMKAWNISADSANPVLCVMGGPGYGKSTLLADLIKYKTTSKKCRYNIFYHFCGPCSNHCVLLARLISFLDALNEDKGDNHENYDEYLAWSENDLSIKFKKSLQQCSTKPINIIIDAVNELLSHQSINHLSWFPPAFPSNILCVVSCADNHLPTKARLDSRLTKQLVVDRLPDEACKLLVEDFFFKFSKTTLKNLIQKLDDEQRSLLLEKAQSVSPLWLKIACEELRIVGDYMKVTEMIEQLDINMDGLLSQIITRLDRDDHTKSLKKLLALIACSENGIVETDVCPLIGDYKENKPLPPSYWAHLRRVLSSFIKTNPFTLPTIDFVHGTVKKSVVDICKLRDPKTEQSWHASLADFYQFYCKRDVTKVLPDHLLKAGYTKRLLDFLENRHNKIKVPIYKQRMFKQKLRCQQPIVPNTSSPAIICNFCGVHNIGENNECLFCNLRYPNQSLSVAMLCMQHRSLHQCICIKCAKVTAKSMIKCEAKICNFCNVGLNKCCKLVVK